MKVQGSCHCGQIRYEAEVDPAKVSLCSCTDCQMLSGSAYRISIPAPRETFRLLAGVPTTYVKTAQSGTRRRHSFCASCGTPVASTADSEDPPAYSLRVGCLQQRHHLPPRRRQWCQSELAWSLDLSEVPGIDAQ